MLQTVLVQYSFKHSYAKLPASRFNREHTHGDTTQETAAASVAASSAESPDATPLGRGRTISGSHLIHIFPSFPS